MNSHRCVFEAFAEDLLAKKHISRRVAEAVFVCGKMFILLKHC